MKLLQMFIIPYIKRYSRSVLLVVFFGVLTIIGSSMLTFTSGYLISSASLMPINILILYVPIVLVRTFGISQAITRYLERLIGHNAVLKILSNMRVHLYQMLEPQALFIRSRFQTGDLLGTLADDIEHLQDVYIRTIFPTLVALFVLVISVISIAFLDFTFAIWVGLCFSIIVIIYPLISLYLLKRRQIEQRKLKSNLYSSLTDAVFGISDWIISGNQKSYMSHFIIESQKNNAIDRRLHHWYQSREFQLRVISGFILIMVGIWAGGKAEEGLIGPTYIAAFTLVTIPMIEGLIPVSRAIERIPSYKESLKRLERIQTFMPKEMNNNILHDSSLYDKGEILINHVSFSYHQNQGDETLKDINLAIKQGEKIAILGKSGAGKSTLLQLLLGVMVPYQGDIMINGYSPIQYGEEIYQVMGILNQKPYLFATTVENNIRLGNDKATREEIERVIELVKLDKYVHSLPRGLLTQMEETGQRFSGGERQRIALARILLKNTPIVVLDEPTVGLDPQTEYDLLKTIFEVLKDKTVILITHHLIGIEKMDQIVFMDKGRIAMKGDHHLLLETNERYRQLYKLDRGI